MLILITDDITLPMTIVQVSAIKESQVSETVHILILVHLPTKPKIDGVRIIFTLNLIADFTNRDVISR